MWRWLKRILEWGEHAEFLDSVVHWSVDKIAGAAVTGALGLILSSARGMAGIWVFLIGLLCATIGYFLLGVFRWARLGKPKPPDYRVDGSIPKTPVGPESDARVASGNRNVTYNIYDGAKVEIHYHEVQRASFRDGIDAVPKLAPGSFPQPARLLIDPNTLELKDAANVASIAQTGITPDGGVRFFDVVYKNPIDSPTFSSQHTTSSAVSVTSTRATIAVEKDARLVDVTVTGTATMAPFIAEGKGNPSKPE